MRSADNAAGWLSHYRRTLRWAERAEQLLEALPETDFHDALDFTLAYFVWCHSLRDWLIKTGALDENTINAELKKYPEWKRVRDLGNRQRHPVLTQNPTDADWAMAREYDVFSPVLEGRERHHLNLYFDGEKLLVLPLLRKSRSMWQSILEEKGLV